MAGGIWSRKFDYKNGEDRKCKHCGAEFHAKKPLWRCQSCINANQKIIEERKRAKYEKKDQYPFNNKTSEASNRFCKIRTALSNAWKEYNKTGDRSVITAHYEKQLKEIEENGIMTWIIDRRDDATKKEKQLKSRTTIRKDYPNHHDYYEY
jgi:hypothetical protein